MTVIGEPQITNVTKKVKPYTRIAYLPDYKRFAIKPEQIATMDIWKTFHRRAYDASACTDKTCAIYYNGAKIPVKTFEDYVNLYIGNKREAKRVYYSPNDRWEVVVCLSPQGDAENISFVNGIYTDQGGRHVSHVLDALGKKIADNYNDGARKNQVKLTPAAVKRNIWVFIRSTIDDPSFKSQTKRFMSTPVANFGSRCDLSEEFVEKANKLGIAKHAKEFAELQAKRAIDKSSNGPRKKRIYNEKLVDAPKAPSPEAILVLTEGDSAAKFFKAGIKGLPEREQKFWGCFPLKGKLLNINTATLTQLADNEEIKNIKQIVGLSTDQTYEKKTDLKKLRYGRIMILADADHDGFHIKGLVMNFIYGNWPSLFKHGNFVCSFATPIVKSWPSRYSDIDPPLAETKEFYSMVEHERFMETHPTGWSHKYFKGLGTSKPEDAYLAFQHMKVTDYNLGDETVDVNGVEVNASDYAIKLAFMGKRGDHRKEWIQNYLDSQVDEPAHDLKQESVANFLNKRMIQFSVADCIRSIPSIVDGLKPSQRKIIYAYTKRNYKGEVKVSQLGGAVTEVANYHHGEKSMNDTIIGLANDYVGHTNINLLHPSGQFGSRSGGDTDGKMGADAAAPRYISVAKTTYLKLLFNKNDSNLLNYCVDDGKKVEPHFYVPIIPLVLANGASGTGTGWSTAIPRFNPMDLIANIRRYLQKQDLLTMTPYQRGFYGKIERLSHNKYVTVGKYIRLDKNTIQVLELPVGYRNCMSFTRYKRFLNGLVDGEKQNNRKRKGTSKLDESVGSITSKFITKTPVVSYDILSETDTNMTVNITFKDGLLDRELADNRDYKFEKKLRLAYAFSSTNMHLYNAQGKIKKYETPEDILREYCDLRLDYYQRRIDYDIEELKHAIELNNLRYRFMNEIMDDKIVIFRKNKAQLTAILSGTAEEGAASPSYPEMTNKAHDDQSEASYEYLLSTKVDYFTKEKLELLRKQREHLEQELADMQQASPIDLWLKELDEFERIYQEEQAKWLKRHKLDKHPAAGSSFTISMNRKTRSQKGLTLTAPKKGLTLTAPKKCLTLTAPKKGLTLTAPKKNLTLTAPKKSLTLTAPKKLGMTLSLKK